MVKETKVTNPFKGYVTKNIKYRDEKEYLELTSAIESNDQPVILDIISQIYFEGRLRWE